MTDVSIPLPEVKMQGRSGCRLDVLKEGSRVIIKKYSCSLDYNDRLIKQAVKQYNFYNNIKSNSSFSTARVIETYSSQNSLAWFTMPYLFSEKYSDYLEKASVIELKKLLAAILNYFDTSLKESLPGTVELVIISSKIEDLVQKVKKTSFTGRDYFLSVLNYLKANIPNNPLPLGACHGDLTFSNILFSDDKVYLLDFLDSFIESPIIDIVKLRQDTCFKWSIMLEKEMPLHKKNKLIQTFNYFDREISLLCENRQLNEWYHYLQVFNLIRIVPYLTDDAELLFIEKSLRQLL